MDLAVRVINDNPAKTVHLSHVGVSSLSKWSYSLCRLACVVYLYLCVFCCTHTHTAICAHPSLYTLLANCQHTLIFTYFSSIHGHVS